MKDMAPVNDVLVAGRKYISYNILLQVSLRVLSFACNAIILRSISGYAFGVINVRLMLLYTTIHSFCREPFRRCCMGKLRDYHDFHKITNILWLPVLLCAAIGYFLRFVWINLLPVPEAHEVSDYPAAVNTVIICLLIEMLAEPLFILGVNFHFIKLKVIVEGMYNTVRSLSMAVLVSKYSKPGIEAFCCSQVLASVSYCFVYYIYFWTFLWHQQRTRKSDGLPLMSLAEIIPKVKREFADWETIVLAWSFIKQTLLKQLLTEGEKYLMTVFHLLDFSEQGTYEVVNNLGSLVARLIFLPIEESFYNVFSSLLRRGPVQHEPSENVKISARILQNMFKFMLLIGFTCFSFGIPYSQMLLYIYGGNVLSNSEALQLLQWHCFYILFIAINGITEAFVFAVMTSSQLDKRNILTMLLSLSFLLLSYVLTKAFGAVGFILANCVNMGLRTSLSFHFIQKYFDHKNLSWFFEEALPSIYLLSVYLLSFILMTTSDAYFCCSHSVVANLLHIAVGLFCSIFVVGSFYIFEKRLINFLISDWCSDKKSR